MLAQPVELGLGACEAVAVPGRGRVAAVFSRAAYLQLPGGLIALASEEVPSGPVHARGRFAPSRLRTGDPVLVTDSLLQANGILLDLRRARIWEGRLPPAAKLDEARRLAIGLLDKAPASPMLGEIAGLDESLSRGDLAAPARRLGGRGPGLTPAGDDCLAGVLLIARIRWGRAAEEGLVELAAGVETNDIAGIFLHWAARGQSIEPVHRFLTSAAGGDRQAAAEALDRLVVFGHSSGADLALGLRLGLGELGAEAPQQLCSCPP